MIDKEEAFIWFKIGHDTSPADGRYWSPEQLSATFTEEWAKAHASKLTPEYGDTNHNPPPEPRPGWDLYFMFVARVVARRGSCDRLRVGAVLTRDNRILTTGYNGAASGTPSCEEAGHELMEVEGRMSCQRTIHAEANTIFQCAKHGIRLDSGFTAYVTVNPCYNCLIALKQAGVHRIVYGSPYKSARTGKLDVHEVAERFGILMQRIDDEGRLWQNGF